MKKTLHILTPLSKASGKIPGWGWATRTMVNHTGKHPVNKLLIFLLAFVFFEGMVQAQTTVTYVMQDANFPVQFNDGGDFFNNGAAELGMWANAGNKNTVAWRTFKTAGDGSGSDRNLQVGDVFKITISATRAYGQIGFSLNAGGTQGSSWDNRISGSRLYFNTVNYAAWVVNRNGGNSSLSYVPIQSSYKNYIFTVKITSATTADVFLTVDGTDYRAFNLTMNGTNNIDAFSVYGSDMWDGDTNDDAFWKQTCTVTNSKTVQLGYYLASGTYTPGLISDGLDAGSTTTVSANSVFVGGDAGSAVILSEANTYTGTTTINANATLRLGASGGIPDASNMVLNAGTFSTGATTGFSETMGTLMLSDNSTIALGTGSHTINFGASDGLSWSSGKTLTVNGWTGTGGLSGTGGQVFFGSSSGGLTTGQLAQISFTGFAGTAVILSTGEIVPPAAAPTLSGFEVSGPGSGTSGYVGCTVTVTGTNFLPITTVKVGGSGGTTVPSFTIVNSTTITFTSIAAAGAIFITDGTNSITSGSSYTNLGYITNAATDWNTGSTWLGNAVPEAGSNVTVANNITLNAAATNTTFNNLTINASSGITFGASGAITVTGTLTNGGAVDMTTGGTINFASGVTFANGTSVFTAGTGTIAFAGTGTISGTIGFNNVTIAGGVNFGSGSTINGSLSINAGGYVNSNAPVYATGSVLKYNTGGPYGRSTEWSATSGAGYPYHIQISNNTQLNVTNGANVQRQIAGNLTVDAGSTFSMEGMTIGNPTVIGVIVLGDVTNYGTITLATSTERLKTSNFTNHNITTLSTNGGGDLELSGNLIDNATFNANTRAVFFTGTGTQEVSGTSSPLNIDYLVISKTTGSVRMLQNLLCEGPNGGNAISFSSATDVLDLNGFTLTLGKAAVTSGISGVGVFKGGNNSSINILGAGSFGTIYFDQATAGTTNLLKDFGINRTSSGSITLGNSLLVTGTLTTSATTTFNIPASTVLTIGSLCQATLSGTLTNSAGTGGLVTLSDATGTGSLINNTSGVDATVQRYLTQTYYHYIASPVAAQTISPGFIDVTQTVESQAGIDFFRWDEITNTWDNIKQTSTTWDPAFTTFDVGRGYVYSNTSENVTKNFAGQMNVGDKTIKLTVTPDEGNGWNLIGNPFASTLAVTTGAQATDNLIDANSSIYEPGYAALYFWKEQAGYSGTARFAEYEVINNTSGTYYVNPGQAFMIKAKTHNSDYAFTANMRKHGTSAFYKSTSSDDYGRFYLTIAGPEGDYNETLLGFVPEATNDLDEGFDAIKLKGNPSIALYSKLINGDDGDFAIQALPSFTGNEVIPISLDANKTGTYSFNAGNRENLDNISIKLEDRLTNTFTTLDETSGYSFTVLSASTINNRFYLHFKSSVGVDDQADAEKAIYSYGKTLYFETSGKATIEVFNLTGQKIEYREVNSSGLQTFSINAPTGWYIVKLVTVSGVKSEKIFIN